jgi:hypothetical protein
LAGEAAEIVYHLHWVSLGFPVNLTLTGITGFEVLSLKGKVEKGKIVEYRLTMEVTFILD